MIKIHKKVDSFYQIWGLLPFCVITPKEIQKKELNETVL